ncbi:adenosylmethionine-8-amino-7-oxononanoate aminotransferase [Legionella quinlivanii]|uniref:adenosylmethionine--8-amino-7-oxononanoate transaminase n=1 Tax=Legionella quinlivanii TaxID=45073 RepID=A0A0W0Y3I6_9GAMM|nr:adenosylmethionine--8-amino-7-oxononanoate transaminase [Legionella quinlivanii]KTD51547.1 adenosylmethionine-8-amino-7-oxononanoate aminotransferase [Legionella quinlivanii]SEF58605.1 adenosylmethionine-8-amino-7-oxononanoate aminotransferase [Legionella quinlivanii DSM 21216]STY10926.1 adenosylmethionine-8-amino-7-oxononanoate aminotransferase [Legionella quinlivanii]
MVNIDCIDKDLRHIWHPCMQMKDFEQSRPVVVNNAKGSYLYTDKGVLIDAISSWWCKSLGHRHPAIQSAIKKQLEQFEQVIAANTTHPALAELGEQLAFLSGKQHSFFASDGSSAVEIALKLALHTSQLKGNHEKRDFIALKNAYHGETLGALGVSDLGIYKQPYEGIGPRCHFIESIPYVNHSKDPLWTDCSGYWDKTLDSLESLKSTACAIIVEPIIQGAGGMLCYSADFLLKLAQWAKANNIYLIADEIMTGMCRTGEWFAFQHAGIQPDMICLSKGLTGGTIPLSCVLIDDEIYQLFYHDYEKGRSFLHSHTHSANAIGVAAALAAIKTMQLEKTEQQATRLGHMMHSLFKEIADKTNKLHNVRSIGAMVAAELVPNPKHSRTGFYFYQQALKRGALLRPMGDTIYWLPPLNSDDETIVKLAEITLNSIYATYR